MKFDPSEINIVYASDDNFVDIMGISMLSLFDNHKGTDLCVYILSDEISESNKEILKNLATAYDQKLVIIDLNFDKLTFVKFDILTWARAAFSRLFIGTLLAPYKVERVIYLDCDTIICTNLMELWNYELNHHVLGAVMDSVSRGHKKNIEIEYDKPYFNSGVLLIDLKKWCSHKCEERMQAFAMKKNGRTPYVDQGLINGALKGDIAALPLKFNVSTLYVDYSYDEIQVYRHPGKVTYSSEEIQEAVKMPAIVHYTKSIFTERPWFVNQNHKERERWLYYKNISPWKDKELLTRKIKTTTRIYVSLSKKWPRKIDLFVRGILHSYIKPIIDRY